MARVAVVVKGQVERRAVAAVSTLNAAAPYFAIDNGNRGDHFRSYLLP